MSVLAFAGIVEKALGITDKLIEDGQAQRSTEEHNERIAKANTLLSQTDSDDRSNDIAEFVDRVCIDAGEVAAGDLSRVITVPLSHFTALIEIASQKIKMDRDLAAAEQKLRSI